MPTLTMEGVRHASRGPGVYRITYRSSVHPDYRSAVIVANSAEGAVWIAWEQRGDFEPHDDIISVEYLRRKWRK